jgi:hypothetical protein
LLISLALVAALYGSYVARRAAATVEYLGSVRTSSEQLAKDTGLFLDSLGRLESMDRTEFVTVVDTIASDLVGASSVTESESPEGMEGSATLFRLAVEAWSEGLGQFKQAVLEAADSPGSFAGTDLMAAGLFRMASGDALYLSLLGELARPDVRDPIVPLPEIRFVQTGVPISAAASMLALTASSDASLIRLRSDLSVEQVNSDPSWVRNPNNELVVDATEVIAVEIVVANKGNGASAPLTIALDLDGEGVLTSRTQLVGRLEAGAQTVVRFSDLAVKPGGLYRIEAQLKLSEPDRDLQNNTQTIDFLINTA